MAANFVRQQMSQKKLSASDINEGRVYLPTELVKNLGLADGTEVTVFDVQMNSSTMNFCRRRRDQRAFLGDGWRQFVTDNGFRKDNTVTFYVLRPQGGGGIERTHFQIIRHEAARRAVGRFDLNEPPPPEGSERARGFDLNRPPPPEN
jgi:antitoxin component of MazEF toxin-antitoxin module